MNACTDVQDLQAGWRAIEQVIVAYGLSLRSLCSQSQNIKRGKFSLSIPKSSSTPAPSTTIPTIFSDKDV